MDQELTLNTNDVTSGSRTYTKSTIDVTSGQELTLSTMDVISGSRITLSTMDVTSGSSTYTNHDGCH